jgi:lipopolysaccharide export system protein LptC
MDEHSRTNLVLAAAVLVASRITESKKSTQNLTDMVDEVIMTMKIMENKELAPQGSTKFVPDVIPIRVRS